MTTRGTIEVCRDAGEASRAGAESFARRARAAVERGERFSVALSGGSTPREMYRLLAAPEFRGRIPWEGVHLFWGDERCVPPAHPRSNYGMAEEAFIARVPIPRQNVHRVRGELSPRHAAPLYERELLDFFEGPPRFDLIHLGLGSDAHTASLFPFDPLLRERERWVAATLQRPQGEPRVTLTLPTINAAARVEFLVLGAGKAEVVRSVAAGALDPFRLPAQGVRPQSGELIWILDQAAAAKVRE
jgi:6-phosphogluconolactonase